MQSCKNWSVIKILHLPPRHRPETQMTLRRPHSVSFSKKNLIRPFEDHSSLEFWALKNDASMFVVGQNSKKRPDNLILARTFDNRLLDMCEVGVENFVSMKQLKVRTLLSVPLVI